MRQLFGTDGIRGLAGDYPLDPATTFALGGALAQWARTRHSSSEIVIGMDTRESGPWIAEHVAGGLASEGVHARFAGLITTPGLAHAAKVGPFAAGVMISASHNPYRDNGIKIIDHSGFKLPDEEENAIEDELFARLKKGVAPVPGSLKIDEGLDAEYLEHLAASMPQGMAGMHIAVDGSNGSASYLAPALFERLGARVSMMGGAPDGKNINLNCGSLHLDGLRVHVINNRADAGVAFDGDADRALFVSSSGKIVDGDAVMFILARALHQKGQLSEVVATVMSNLGLERALQRHHIGLVRTAVGDRYVLQEMQRRNAPLGGEQSGHIILRDFATTGDGMLTALRVFDAMRESKLGLDELTAEVETYPQILVNVRVKQKRPLEDLDTANREIRAAEGEFGDAGRVLVRFSGTEPLARVMVEGPHLERVEHFAHSIANAIRADLGD